jgi:hypothetical protein
LHTTAARSSRKFWTACKLLIQSVHILHSTSKNISTILQYISICWIFDIRSYYHSHSQSTP